MLDKYAVTICRNCGGECCHRIGCQFYSRRFATCPIFRYRPAKCRLYFCDKVLDNGALSKEEREVLNRPVIELSKILKRNWGVGIFIEPPVKVGGRDWLSGLGIESRVTEVIKWLEAGRISPKSAQFRLLGIVRDCIRGT